MTGGGNAAIGQNSLSGNIASVAWPEAAIGNNPGTMITTTSQDGVLEAAVAGKRYYLAACCLAMTVAIRRAVEKGTKAVTSVNFSLYGNRIFNNLRTNFAVKIP